MITSLLGMTVGGLPGTSFAFGFLLVVLMTFVIALIQKLFDMVSLRIAIFASGHYLPSLAYRRCKIE